VIFGTSFMHNICALEQIINSNSEKMKAVFICKMNHRTCPQSRWVSGLICCSEF
jgi:hypothetical protein